jgi:3-isopropylmalate/(R)-2-methylmalate dehydratase small subunit
VLGAGIRAVLARSFARTYYRNAVNNGLIPITCDTRRIREGDRLVIDSSQELVVRNLTTADTIEAEALPRIMLEILEAGGLVPYFRQHGNFRLP